MDANENKFKKTWGDKWHSNKTGKFPIEKQMIETSGFMVHPDYLNKYGTLSNGVLTKSIKYAETWLYGTVGVRGTPTQRPSLFLYPGVAPSPPRMINQNNYPTSSGAFLSMPILNYSSPSSERNGYPVQPPRKHTDQCFNSNQNELRIYQCNDNNKGIESELCLSDKRSREKKSATYRSTLSKNRSSLRDSISVREKRNNSTSLDPYSLMRKNRLGVDSHLESTQSKRRTASVPSMGSVRIRDVSSPCYDAFKPKTSGYEANLRISEDNWEEAEEETTRRKSILECDVNAYELNKSKTKDFDDFSDELSHSVSKADLAKLKIMRPKLNKTDLRVPSGRSLESEKAKVQNENSKKFEVRLSGQRLRICDSSASTSAAVGGCAIEEEDSQNILPRLPSPKRPPRRQKEKAIGETTFKYSKSRSKSSPNLSIKSILKKPMGAAEEAILPDVPFDSPSVSSPFPAEKILSNNPGSTVKSQSQCTLKKKKQVQFRVNNSYESLSKTSPFDSESQESGQKSATEKSISHESEKPEIIEKESFYRSKSCENLSSIGQNKNRPSEIDIENKNDEGECDNRKASDVNGKRDLHSEGE